MEHDEDHRARLKALLAQRGFYAEAAVDGLDAVQRARLGWFDVILMNTGIPEVDGLAAARLIIKLTQDHGSPRIIALATDPAALLQRGEDARRLFFAVVSSPCDRADLLEAVCLALGEEAIPSQDAVEDRCCAADRLPCPGSHAVWPKRRAEGAPRWCRILLVDDDDFQRDVLCTLLRDQGYEVEPARDGLEAVLKMGNGSYDAAVLDFDLPRMNGMAAARLAHDLLSRSERPSLIALTATPEAVQDRERVSFPLFDNIIGKSIGLGSVVEAVEKCLSSRAGIGLRKQAGLAGPA